MSTRSPHQKEISRKQVSWRARLFDGWQLGASVVAVAIIVTLLAIPRPELPDTIPLPQIDRQSLEHAEQRDNRLASEALREELPYDLRVIGESIRKVGASEGRDEPEARNQLSAIRGNRSRTPEDLEKLRAVQLSLFLEALTKDRNQPDRDSTLRELGGSLSGTLEQWAATAGTRSALDSFVRAMFKKRWNDLVGLSAPALRKEEELVILRFLLVHPPAEVRNKARTGLACHELSQYRQKRVLDVGRIDPSYPVGYALGILLLQQGRPHEAVGPLTAHLEAHADGPHTLRARNALRLAQEQVFETMDANAHGL